MSSTRVRELAERVLKPLNVQGLASDTTAADALRMTLSLVGRHADHPPLHAALSQAGANCVQDLRGWSLADWNAFRSLPLMARVYLRLLVSLPYHDESGAGVALTPLQRLECSLNRGLALELNRYESALDTLQGMGFSKVTALEALLVTGHRTAEHALEYLFQNAAEREFMLKKAMQGRSVPESQHHSRIKEAVVPTQGDAVPQQSIQATERVELDLTATVMSGVMDPRVLYAKFVGQLVRQEHITMFELQQLQVFRRQHDISNDKHRAALVAAGISQEEFDELLEMEESERRRLECVICLSPSKEWVVLDCMHVCLCEDCAISLKNSPEPKCPLCQNRVADIRRAFL